MSPSRLVGSYPTFSPLPRLNEAVIFFYVTPAVADTLHINKRDALCCPDFPHTPKGKRQTVQLLSEREDTTNQPKKQKTFISTSESRTKASFHYAETSSLGEKACPHETLEILYIFFVAYW